ncbi:MAG: BON domain-containing protein [Armatimonadetes bacterium]|nr:BON domain-containing protein [Armatimonadota bacterium]
MRGRRWLWVLGVAPLLAPGCRPVPEPGAEAAGAAHEPPVMVAPALEQALRAGIRRARGAGAEHVNVDVVDGVVVLSGLVPSDLDRQRIVEMTRQASGIAEVRDRMILGRLEGAAPVVRPSPGPPPSGSPPVPLDVAPGQPRPPAQSTAPADEDVEARVNQALVENQAVDAASIRVSASNGVVTLRGQVARQEEKSAAARVAAGQPGVREVDDQLTVAGGSTGAGH